MVEDLATLGAEGVGVVKDRGDAALLIQIWRIEPKAHETLTADGRLINPLATHCSKDSSTETPLKPASKICWVQAI